MSDQDGPRVETSEDSAEVIPSNEPPSLWPLPIVAHYNFAKTETHYLAWDIGGFRVRKLGFLDKTVAHFPMSEEGWTRCFSALETDYPDLAAAVVTRAILERGKVQRRAAEKAFKEELVVAEKLASVPGAVLLGGHGYGEEFQPRTSLDLYFTTEGLWASLSGRATPVLRTPYSEITAVDFDGPGKVAKGGGFFGGGFGVKGAMEGMAIAAVLNSLTTTSDIRSIIRLEARLEARTMEAFFFTDSATPGDLRINFSAVLGRLRKVSSESGKASPDALDRLERLAKLHREGSLTDDEFAAMKRQIIADKDPF